MLASSLSKIIGSSKLQLSVFLLESEQSGNWLNQFALGTLYGDYVSCRIDTNSNAGGHSDGCFTDT